MALIQHRPSPHPKLFLEFDVDSSGTLDKQEFSNLVTHLEKKMGKIGHKWKRKVREVCVISDDKHYFTLTYTLFSP